MSITNHALPTAGLSDYVAIARPDHWIKHVLIIPGVAFAMIMSGTGPADYTALAGHLLTCLFAAMALSSANYTINEWLDAPFDAMHPTKRSRPAVQTAMSPTIVFAQYILLTTVGVLAANTLGGSFATVAVVFAVFGVIYNVRPIRAKDRAFLDVVVESVNNPLRFLFGWFAVTPHIAPPVSILLAYWFGGAFMMAIFLLKYRIEYLVVIPLFIALFASYMRLALTPDSAAARPEELMRQPAMLIGAAVTMALFGVLTFVDLPWLNGLTSSDLIHLTVAR
jgi:4-hydroxybenzoate polyprenyltransferase